MKNKLKTHKWAQKRIKITKKGKLISKKSCNNHLLTNKGKTNKKFQYGKVLTKAAVKSVADLLPYKK